MLRKVYGVANSILANTKYVLDLVRLSLIESFVLPVLMYGVDAVDLSQSHMRELSVCVNNIYLNLMMSTGSVCQVPRSLLVEFVYI